jgi:hypothetical protein
MLESACRYMNLADEAAAAERPNFIRQLDAASWRRSEPIAANDPIF